MLLTILIALNLCAIGLAGTHMNNRDAAEKRFWREWDEARAHDASVSLHDYQRKPKRL